MTTPARTAVERFLETFVNGSTRSQRRTYINEYLAYLCASRHCRENELTIDDLLDEGTIHDWLAAASRGATRRRTGAKAPYARAAPNSMAARITTINTFSRFCGSPLDLRRPRPDPACRLTSVEAHRTVRLLAAHQPPRMLAATWERSVAVVALVACTRRGLPEVHAMRLRDVELGRERPRVRVAGEWYPLDVLSRDVLARWLLAHQRLTARRRKVFSVDSLWVTTGAGRARAAGLPATLRTLVAAHRNLTVQVLGSPLLLAQFRPAGGCGRNPFPERISLHGVAEAGDGERVAAVIRAISGGSRHYVRGGDQGGRASQVWSRPETAQGRLAGLSSVDRRGDPSRPGRTAARRSLR
ncbi:hypothetical protein [Streptomyces sp. BRA346]|uniref:hypothetical protein n=1 Tax=Streptomyces sp. BRA346 TaxID=2878199 RepID=UPI004063E9F3